MNSPVKTDIVIIGGGVAGLWLLNRLRQLNYAVILLEGNTLGGGQTHQSQGIIHGGMKYALQGAYTKAAQEVADMPTLWQHCLQGQGEINLSQVPILSQQQYLWAKGKFTSQLAGFFANVTLQGKIELLSPAIYPAVFQNTAFKGKVYALNEMVIDVPALIHALAKPHLDVIYKINPLTENHLCLTDTGELSGLRIENAGQSLEIKASQYIFTAGSGNELLEKKFKNTLFKAQRRPLHMVLAKTPFAYALYAHCLGLSATPRLTITTHQTNTGETVWYLGGQLAEEGMQRDHAQQINLARRELMTLFPWLDWSAVQFAAFFVDRAESFQIDGKRPDSSSLQISGNCTAAWPTKLALAPKLAQDIMAQLQRSAIKPTPGDLTQLAHWSKPPITEPIWETLLC